MRFEKWIGLLLLAPPACSSRFTAPRSYNKWNSRVKCKFYYYRTNYFIMIIFFLGMAFLWKPLGIVAAFLTGLSIAFLNDSFAVTFNEKGTRTVRQFSHHLAAKMRPPITPVLRGRPSSRRVIYICGRPHWVFVLMLSAASCILWITSRCLLTVLWALVIGLTDKNIQLIYNFSNSHECVNISIYAYGVYLLSLAATLLHASLRTPNLKA